MYVINQLIYIICIVYERKCLIKNKTMHLIVITEPQFVTNEANIIAQLLHWGVGLVHLRKPESNADDLAKLIEAIPTAYHNRLVLHDHFDLATHFALHGLHLNRRNYVLPPNYKGAVSKSCHTISEVETYNSIAITFFLVLFLIAFQNKDMPLLSHQRLFSKQNRKALSMKKWLRWAELPQPISIK